MPTIQGLPSRSEVADRDVEFITPPLLLRNLNTFANALRNHRVPGRRHGSNCGGTRRLRLPCTADIGGQVTTRQLVQLASSTEAARPCSASTAARPDGGRAPCLSPETPLPARRRTEAPSGSRPFTPCRFAQPGTLSHPAATPLIIHVGRGDQRIRDANSRIRDAGEKSKVATSMRVHTTPPR